MKAFMILANLFTMNTLLAAQDLNSSEKGTHAASASLESRGSLNIQSKSRAQDYTQAFEILKREKPTLKIDIQTTTGTLNGVLDLSATDNGTLMLVKIPFTQGTKYLILPIEDIREIAYSP